uniref:Uncharacterized protein n=1 Tax=Rhizobium rhizogenes TaxID=359 RepID=A0A4V1DXD0_RHIRH|nr:hypothetical protein pOC-C5.8_541 [Rhizobium rhizogenes]
MVHQSHLQLNLLSSASTNGRMPTRQRRTGWQGDGSSGKFPESLTFGGLRLQNRNSHFWEDVS